MDYSKTVNLLQTDFPMKADLPVREPKMLEQWETAGLYEKMVKHRAGRPLFLLHDGPPYANGDIHMGHALNKTLKDFVVKYKSLAGFQSPYKPGWDCHGLPIEHQLFKQLGKNKHQISRVDLRQKATEYALSWVDKQRAGFKRLGVLGEWGNPYLTLSKEYVAGIVETFFALRDKDFVYRGLKPGYWCAFDETALAEAEVEYADKKSDSVYVRFKFTTDHDYGGKPVTPVNGLVASTLKELNAYILVWTTTPWTLPANQGLAFHPDEKYGFIKKGSDYYVVAEKLKDHIAKKIGAEVASSQPTFSGKEFENLYAVNPVTATPNSQMVNATYVTMEDGTGIVHIAPGHGVEDFGVGQKYRMKVVSPVDEKGQFDDTVQPAELKGKHVLKDANTEVMKVLGDNLLLHIPITHSYPHCWRCKNPIIFRATEQWFMRVSDEFRAKLLAEIDNVRWEPAYGVHRIKGMVETRPDWCLSRQRHWGAPIAVLYCKGCRTPLNDKKVNAAIVKLINEKGVDAWYQTPEAEFLAPLKVACGSCGKSDFVKETDILDVWFDSGVSWHSVIEKDFSNPIPDAVMYLEGSDQHRGWFQTSLLPSTAINDQAPFDVVLTHGFVVDGKGKKMSKSLGNVIGPQEIIEKYGADILRLWVAMSDYREDVRLSQDIVKHMIDVYRRFRNTFRFLLQNTVDFKRKEDAVPLDKLEDIDKWILDCFADLKTRVCKAYDAYEFHIVLSELNRFVSVELSGFYLDALKDRLYCEAPNSPIRRSTQTALFHLTRGLSVLLAPLLSFTSEEAYLELRKVSDPLLADSVFLDEIADLTVGWPKWDLSAKWNGILEIRAKVNDELDRQRKSGVVKSSQEAEAHINPAKLTDAERAVLADQKDWPFLLQMADLQMNGNDPNSNAVTIGATKFAKCERCWRHRADVGQSQAHPTLCGRCVTVVETLPL